MARLRRRLIILILLISATLTVGTTGFTLIDGYPLFDAFYMTVITITTVGYFEVRPLSQLGRLFNSFLLLFGVSVMFYAIGIITQSVIELEFSEFFGKRRMKRTIENLRDHVLLCGFGRVGRGAAAELARSGHPFVVLDSDERRVERAVRAGMLAMAADCTLDENLREAGVERARGLIAALATDADNLFLILSAKSINPRLVVTSRVSEETAEHKLRRAGADALFMPYSVTGHRLAQAILRPHVFEFLDSTTGAMGLNVGIEQVLVGHDSPFASRSIRDLQLRRQLGVIVLAIRRATSEMLFNPPADALINGGDYLVVMGGPEELAKLEKFLAGAVS